jgi:peptidoglycan/LPS O-acetylase OafA/YrhL
VLVFVVLSFDPMALLFTTTFLVNYIFEYLNDYNGHFWSLCVEVHFYIAIALVVLVAGRRGLWIVWPACLAVTLLRVNAGAFININTHLRVDEILAGACVATLYRTAWLRTARYPIVLASLASLLWFVCSSPYAGWLQYMRPYATGLFLAAVLCAGKTRLADVLGSQPMRYIAATSYALYIVHPLTVHGWLNQGSAIERYLLKRPISFAMTFLLAHLSTFYWERPWMQVGKKWIERRRVRRLQTEISPSPDGQTAA